MSKNQKGSKRAAVDKNQTTIFAVVAIASVITVGSLMVAKGLWSQSSYLNKVAGKKEVAVDQLEKNKVAVASLTEAYNKFNGQSPNLLGGNVTGTGPRDGSNGELVLDALPNKYDFPALTASLEKLLSGYTIEDIGGRDDSLAQQSAASGVAVEIPFTFDVKTSYDGFKQLLDTFNKSIRPFNMTSLELSGENANLNVSVEAKTFYQPDTGIEVKSQKVE